jgi:hypothetical protein
VTLVLHRLRDAERGDEGEGESVKKQKVRIKKKGNSSIQEPPKIWGTARLVSWAQLRKGVSRQP